MTQLDLAAQHRIVSSIATGIHAKPEQVQAAVKLLDSGDTVPFIARYRKEVTGGLDDAQLRELESELEYRRGLEERRGTILESIRTQGKLTDKIARAINEADTKQRLEDLYLPFKPKRRSRAQTAKEAGLEPLADALLKDRSLRPETEAAKFIHTDKGIDSAKTALEGARDILSERFAENADMLESLREFLWNNADMASAVIPEKQKATEAATFKDYFAFSEPIRKVPSHRALAMFRGRDAGYLKLSVRLNDEVEAHPVHPCETMIAEFLNLENKGQPADAWLESVVRWTWRVKCAWQLESDLFSRLRDASQEAAIEVFGTNLKDLLLAPPAGHKAVIGLDPGIRTGVKVAVISETGAVLETGTIFPHEPRNEWQSSIEILANLAKKHTASLVAIGNGTASRETDKLVGELIADHPELNLTKVVVSEAGASVYSASKSAASELPDLDVSLRGAVSIARRLQDPLAELVKIEPKAIGVGQYQHDVNQTKLSTKLDAVVEDCVNAVGVDLNTASCALLCRVSGLNSLQAKRIVDYREKTGAFKDRQALMNVPRFGEKTFEQSAGFLRIIGGTNPLDASCVHPESYPVVEKIVEKTGLSVDKLIGNHAVLSQLQASDFTDNRFGLPTVKDIFRELEKPGRDPRPEFKAARFDDSVRALKDLTTGMILEGVVTNVTAFGAFVDIGVHQDGLLHISEMSSRFVRDPRQIVHVGQIIKVRVLSVDLERRRAALSMKLTPEVKKGPAAKASSPEQRNRSEENPRHKNPERIARRERTRAAAQHDTHHAPRSDSAMARAFANAFHKP